MKCGMNNLFPSLKDLYPETSEPDLKANKIKVWGKEETKFDQENSKLNYNSSSSLIDCNHGKVKQIKSISKIGK